MRETPEEQRQRLYAKRVSEYDGELIKCLVWSLRDLQVECARLNQVLKEVIEITEKASRDNE